MRSEERRIKEEKEGWKGLRTTDFLRTHAHRQITYTLKQIRI